MDISLEKKVTSPLVIMSGSLDSAAHENVPVTAVVRSGFTKPRVEVSEKNNLYRTFLSADPSVYGPGYISRPARVHPTNLHKGKQN